MTALPVHNFDRKVAMDMNQMNKIERQAHFVLCESCFWCASDVAGGLVEKCPACGGVLFSAPVHEETLVVSARIRN